VFLQTKAQTPLVQVVVDCRRICCGFVETVVVQQIKQVEFEL